MIPSAVPEHQPLWGTKYRKSKCLILESREECLAFSCGSGVDDLNSKLAWSEEKKATQAEKFYFSSSQAWDEVFFVDVS